MVWCNLPLIKVVLFCCSKRERLVVTLVLKCREPKMPRCRMRAEVQRIGRKSYPRQVKAVGMPAGPDGDILVIVSMRMARNGVGQKGKLAVIEINMDCADFARKLSGALPMHGVPAFAFTASVMKECKVFHHAPVRPRVPGQKQAVAPDACPVGSAVQALPFEAELPA